MRIKQASSLILVLVFLLKYLAMPVSYSTANEFIAKNLCVQKDAAKNCCKGKCILKHVNDDQSSSETTDVIPGVSDCLVLNESNNAPTSSNFKGLLPETKEIWLSAIIETHSPPPKPLV